MNTQLLVIAKAPVPGRVKTRLCPPCTPEQAAALAAAALADTLDAAAAMPAASHTLVLDGYYTPPAGWAVVPQRHGCLGERLTAAFADTARPGLASLLIGMDTPQVEPALLADVAARLIGADAVLCPATDGGWWALALRDPGAARTLRTVPTSRADTAALTLSALRDAGLRVATGPALCDVDTAADARAVAAQCAGTRFATAVRAHLANGEPAEPVHSGAGDAGRKARP